MKVREVIKLIEVDGWYLARTRGSHRQYKHAIKSGLVTAPGKLSDDLASGTLNSILKQAQLKENIKGASQFCKLTKILIVIANVAQRNEAIAKSSCCDCFAPLHYARNDKLYFYTFGM
ncbi:MAG: type II toxin-antitoxin system HicA family toxin, partial [Mastigocoleus sp.]